jgi:hypothetical protein
MGKELMEVGRQTYQDEKGDTTTTVVRGGAGVEEMNFTISRSSRAVSRASSSRDASCAFARASFMSTESGLPSIASMIPGSRSVLRVGGDGATSLPVLLVVEFSMPQRRRLCIVVMFWLSEVVRIQY